MERSAQWTSSTTSSSGASSDSRISSDSTPSHSWTRSKPSPGALAGPGFEVTEVGVDTTGRVVPGELAAAVRDDTLLVCLQHANHEVGTVQPVREAAALAHERGALLLVDACQTVGRLPVDVADLGADLLVGSGHKCYGPPGTGFLVASRRARLRPVLVGP